MNGLSMTARKLSEYVEFVESVRTKQTCCDHDVQEVIKQLRASLGALYIHIATNVAKREIDR